MKSLTLVFLWILQLCFAFRNPIIPGFNPDPSITRAGDDYFLVTSSFEFFPGVPVYHSKDLIKWDLIGHALNRPSQLNMRGTAPSGDIISPPDNTTRMPRSFYVHSKDPFDDASWSDPIYVDLPGFDPDIFVSNGTAHLTVTNGATQINPDAGYFSIFHTTLDLSTGNSLTDYDIFHISSLPQGTPRLAEGSHLYQRNGFFYLLTAEAGTEVQHRSMIKRARTLQGPWEENPNNPILFNGRNMSNPVLSTGHADLVSTLQGKWWIVFLATRPQNPRNSIGVAQLGRETFLAPVEWVDDWPVVNGGVVITEEMQGLYDLQKPKVWRDEFRGGKLKDKAYYTPRTPYKVFHDFKARPAWLRLKGNAYTLADRETPAVLMRKQTEYEVVFSTELDFQPTDKKHEAGVTVFLSIHFHNTVAVMLHPETGKRCVVVRTRTGEDAAVKTGYYDIPEKGTVKLMIKAGRGGYELGFAAGGQKVRYVASVENKWLQTALKGWQNFVGTHFGVYATGNGWPMRVPAVSLYIQRVGRLTHR
ncbi:glycosyl hydrolase [Pyronema domesticum]|nr:glycosyl hydrolase [Pyronema domesticum]